MKNFIFKNGFVAVLAVAFVASSSVANASEASRKIEKAVKLIEQLAESGVRKVKIKDAESIKDALYQVALKEDYVSSEAEFSWVGNSANAWEADSMNWGSTTMKSAYHYITDVEDGEEREAKDDLLHDAKEAFALLQGTGVEFGVAPMGAVQCGVTFAALAIIDLEGGVVYLFSREGSGC